MKGANGTCVPLYRIGICWETAGSLGKGADVQGASDVQAREPGLPRIHRSSQARLLSRNADVSDQVVL